MNQGGNNQPGFNELLNLGAGNGNPQMLQSIGRFGGLPIEDPRLHLRLFLETRMVVDASANGTLLDKSNNEAYEILERIANNDYQYPTTRTGTSRRVAGSFELDVITLLIAQCPLNITSVYYMGNFNTNNNPYSNTYNTVQKQHPNFKWNNEVVGNSNTTVRPNTMNVPPGFHQFIPPKQRV
ncbi:hypothetical protein EPI10_028242 [Gossypium australe]|uniref:Uncharacterized protein n=1 Tax=Gossypium australe TaxID=47621 RepID=A0A5B6UUC3_9ROSI|nr:hypothetical protein EPI10_028242 [Gossypium australe]